MKNLLSTKKNSSNQLFSNFFSKTVTFTKFLPKMRESEFPEFPQCDWKNSMQIEKYRAPKDLKKDTRNCKFK